MLSYLGRCKGSMALSQGQIQWWLANLSKVMCGLPLSLTFLSILLS